MKWKLGLLGFSALLACTAPQALAIGRLADVTVLDRASGATLPLYRYRGEYWVPGRPGARYAIVVRSRVGERLMAVTSVDGINVLTGETASWNQTGYVFSPYLYYQITGWRKSSAEVAAFEFSATPDSYAERTGRPGQVGVIGVALFREAIPQPIAVQPETSRPMDAGNEEFSMRARRDAAPASPSAVASERSGEALAHDQAAPAARQGLAKAMPGPLPNPKLGTGHGQREESRVAQTSFARLQTSPNEIISIRYDSRENLVARGVIREPVHTWPTPNPFPESDHSRYVPDPPPRGF